MYEVIIGKKQYFKHGKIKDKKIFYINDFSEIENLINYCIDHKYRIFSIEHYKPVKIEYN